jgi:hypothetical protein
VKRAVPLSDGLDNFDRTRSLAARRSGRSVANEAAVIPNPGSTADQIPIIETSASTNKCQHVEDKQTQARRISI